MPPQDLPGLLFVHAHPDDETINNGATIAHYAGLGARVHVVTCTLGEEGEVIGDRWTGLAADQADQLGGYRISELSAALQLLGIGDPIFLGGAGRWRDSGMAGTPPRPGRQQRFIDADERDAVGALVAIIREVRPQVVVTYAPDGGYGHPDHIRTHRVTTAAVAAAGPAGRSGDHPGDPWTVPKLYWTVTARTAFDEASAALGAEDLLDHWRVLSGGSGNDGRHGHADHEITTRIDGRHVLAAKVDALGAHATQVAVGPTGRACALSNDIALPILGYEHYVLVSGTPGDVDDQGWETDLLAGVDPA